MINLLTNPFPLWIISFYALDLAHYYHCFGIESPLVQITSLGSALAVSTACQAGRQRAERDMAAAKAELEDECDKLGRRNSDSEALQSVLALENKAKVLTCSCCAAAGLMDALQL